MQYLSGAINEQGHCPACNDNDVMFPDEGGLLSLSEIPIDSFLDVATTDVITDTHVAADNDSSNSNPSNSNDYRCQCWYGGCRVP